ncbi:MAG: hypothetical protein MUO21_04370, partial [Nitrososphaeraceae archaeon]|nr:hypothetical protein [Nitrososphaeraceae archaeon]
TCNKKIIGLNRIKGDITIVNNFLGSVERDVAFLQKEKANYEKMLEKTLKSPLERIFETLNWHWSEMDPEKTTLSTFFGADF